MAANSAYIWWHYFRRGQVSGQVATLITLAIAVIFLFVAITLNISRVAEKKTITAQAADGAAVKLASYVGSYANQLSWSYFGGGTKKCQRRWGTFFKILAAIVLVALAPYLGAAANLAYTGAVISGVSAALNEFVFEPKLAERLQRQLNKLALKDNLSEQAVMYALQKSVNDPVKVTDVYDYDEDEDTTDQINRFSQWYAGRIMALSDANIAKQTELINFLPRLEEFAQAGDEFLDNFTEDATRPLLVEESAAEPADDWAEILAGTNGEFITLLEELNQEGLEFSFWTEDVDPENEANYDEVDQLSDDLNSFYLWALGEEGGLLNQDIDAIVQMSDMLLDQLYSENETEDEEGQTWYYTFQGHSENIDDWRPELYGAIAQLDEMIKEEPDPERQDYLRSLQQRTSTAIVSLSDFQDSLNSFNAEILVFYRQAESADYADKNQATYSWHDSLGWHHVRVQVSSFSMPYIKVKKSWRKICIYLKNHSNDITVTVNRFDESTAASFARRASTPLWKFRYTKDAQAADRIDASNPDQALAYGIASSATARYSYNALPRITKIDQGLTSTVDGGRGGERGHGWRTR